MILFKSAVGLNTHMLIVLSEFLWFGCFKKIDSFQNFVWDPLLALMKNYYNSIYLYYWWYILLHAYISIL